MKKKLIMILFGGVFLILGLVVKTDIKWLNLAFCIAGYLIAGGEVVFEALRNILHGRVFDENFLMSLATIGAFAVGDYPEAVAVMLFYQVGELFQSYAVNKSRKSISDLMDIRPDYANLKRDGKIVKTAPEDVHPGDMIVISAGERVPLDGVIISGSSMLDTSALTGESVPRNVKAGEDVLSGCINVNGTLTVQVKKEYGESTVSKILDLVENASSKKSNSENFITKFAAIYTPIVVIAAVILAVLPPLVSGGGWNDWLYRALTFLVISCPCALVISIPLSFFGGIGGASRSGVLVKGSNYLEALAKTEIVVFDKTGTLTQGVFDVQDISPCNMDSGELLRLAAHAENFSSHPISLSLKRAYGISIDESSVTEVEEISGHGVSALVGETMVLVGGEKLMKKFGIEYDKNASYGTVVHVAADGKYAGYIIISDKVKPDAKKAVAALKNANVRKTVMLTGDTRSAGEKVAAQVGVDDAYFELLPADKVDKVEELLKEKSPKGTLAFVGDGINDAPVLARADIGIAMGGLGSDAAIEAADIVIMTDEPSKISTAMAISKKTLRIANQNIVFALAVKLGVLILGAVGIATMWEAVFADVGVAVIAILNALRALSTKEKIFVSSDGDRGEKAIS